MALNIWLLLAQLGMMIVVLLALKRLREDLYNARKHIEGLLITLERSRQSRRFTRIADGGVTPEIPRARTTSRDTDDLPRTGRQFTGLRFENVGGSDGGDRE